MCFESQEGSSNVEKIHTAVLFFLLVASGCGIVPWNSQGDKIPDPPPVIAATETEPGLTQNAIRTDPEPDKSKTVKRDNLRPASGIEIRRLQEVLKVAGFDPGPIDGVFGSRTRAALLELKTGCAAMDDMPARISGDTAKIRVLQARLKEAGFAPGDIDGIAGPNTRAAVLRYQTGCTACKNLTPSVLALIDDTSASPSANAQKPQGRMRDDISRSAKIETLQGLKPQAEKTKSQGKEEVRLLQQRLKDAGFDPGPIDGIMGPRTRLAAKKFEDSQEPTKSQASTPAKDRTLVY